MADKKISALTSATTPLAGTEVLPIVQSGTTVKVAVSDLTAGRAISATQLTLTTGSVIVANGQGIDFSATPGTGTSELFNDYEEGTWTPGAGDFTVVGAFTSSGTYTKVGRLVTVVAFVSGATSIAGNPGQQITGLPYTPARVSAGSCSYGNRGGGGFMQAFTNGSVYSSGTGVSTSGLYITVTYEV
jgi:hypothetical protein